MSARPALMGIELRCLRNSQNRAMAQKNRWHAVMLPDDYLRKLKQDLSEVEALVESKTRRERALDDRPAYDFDQTPPDEDQPA